MDTNIASDDNIPKRMKLNPIELLSDYYCKQLTIFKARAFPYKAFITWLSYGKSI